MNKSFDLAQDMLFVQLKEMVAVKSPAYIKVKVLPKSPVNEITDQLDDGTYKICVAAPAEGGKANAELLKFLRKTLGLSSASIVSGQTERTKLVRLDR